MLRFIKIPALLLAILMFLCLYGYTVRYIALGGQKTGILGPVIDAYVSWPRLIGPVVNVLMEDKSPSQIANEQDMVSVGNLRDDLFAVTSFYLKNTKTWEIRLINLKDDEVLHRWRFKRKDYNGLGNRQFESARPLSTIVLPDSSVIVMLDPSFNIVRISKDSKIIWHNQDKRYHHTMNLDAENNLWVCAEEAGKFKQANGKVKYYRDDHITKIDVKTGEVIFTKSLTSIFLENGMYGPIFGVHSGSDPLHLNDIEPAFYSTDYWQKGDLFLSLRSISSVYQYRPETGKLIRAIRGPFIGQHDVDIISEHELSIFDNNVPRVGRKISGQSQEEKLIYRADHSRVIVHNLSSGKFQSVFENKMREEDIWTETEGLAQFLSNGSLFVENQNRGEIFV